jgi:hypothetical protein
MGFGFDSLESGWRAPSPMALIQLIYASAAVKPFSGNDLRKLLLKARTNNSAIGVSGLLLYNHGSFFQVLEGEAENVNPLFERIGRDPRHNQVLLLSRKDVEEPCFGDWSMGFLDLDRTAQKLPGFVRLMQANTTFLDLKGDSALVGRLVDGFHTGEWGQTVEL